MHALPTARPDADTVGPEPLPKLWRADDVTALTVLIICVFAFPAQLVVGPLGSAGSPAALVGLGMFAYWALRRLLGYRPPQPSSGRVMAFGVAQLLVVMVSYAYAMSRPLDGIEARAADRGLLSTLSWLGIAFFILDKPPSWERLEVLLRRLRTAVGAVALLGIAQFVTHQTLVDRISIPGLSVNGELQSNALRDGFIRPAGTATHPIEFGVVLTLTLPIAIHYALQDWPRRRWLAWWQVAALAFAIPISLSRTTILCVVVTFAVLLPTWDRSLRIKAGGAVIVALAAVFVLVPRLLGTILKLFSGIGSDGSAASRTDSYGLALQFVARSPLIGRGPGTFLPRYRILDNEYLGRLITVGVLGLAALLAFFLASVYASWSLARRTQDPQVRALSYAFMASLSAGIVGLVTFDASAFPQVPTTMHLLIGCVAGLRWSRAGHPPNLQRPGK